jgi:hypothetical protein
VSLLAAGAVVAMVLGLGVLAWKLHGLVGRDGRAEVPDAERRHSAERFDTTMGELRDLREALGPAERAAASGRRPGRRS